MCTTFWWLDLILVHLRLRFYARGLLCSCIRLLKRLRLTLISCSVWGSCPWLFNTFILLCQLPCRSSFCTQLRYPVLGWLVFKHSQKGERWWYRTFLKNLSVLLDVTAWSAKVWVVSGTAGFMVVMYLFETYLDIRQHAALKLSSLPAPLKGVVSQDKFEKARAYSLDKRFASFCIFFPGFTMILWQTFTPVNHCQGRLCTSGEFENAVYLSNAVSEYRVSFLYIFT